MVDKRTNALIISDIPKKLQPLDQLISTLDSETPQVMIEARIVETSKSFSQDLGIKWGFNAIADAQQGDRHRAATSRPTPPRSTGSTCRAPGPPPTLAFSFGNILDSFTLDIALSDLETEGRGRILSSPKIATQNNERAEIEQGVRIPVVTTTATEINVQFVSASLRLARYASDHGGRDRGHGRDRREQLAGLRESRRRRTADPDAAGPDEDPRRRRRYRGDRRHLHRSTKVRARWASPGSARSRGLGWLFKTRNITNENRELLIFITPKIVKIG